jgi:glycosyltransferase involved in cell wall biosynthesis
VPCVLHIAHFDPPIHGEAMMAGQLRDLAEGWGDLPYHSINAVFATKRDELGGFTLGKLWRLLGYFGATLGAKFRHRADILLVHPAFHAGPFLKESVFIWLGWALRMRVIAWVHMDPNRLELEKRAAWFQAWVRLTVGRVDYFVACAPSLPATWPDWLRCRPHGGIANVVADPLNGAAPAKPGSQPGGRFRIVYLSAMDAQKGWKDLFEAACEVCEVRADVEFHFHGGIGPGENEKVVRQAFSSSRHTDRIQWLGPVWGEEKIRKLCAADLFVFPSHTEQFPLVVLEAMACGLPIIATDVGAVRDAFSNNAGVLIKAGSPGLLRAQIVGTLEELPKLAEMGRNARQEFLEQFSLEGFSRRWQAVFIGRQDGRRWR